MKNIIAFLGSPSINIEESDELSVTQFPKESQEPTEYETKEPSAINIEDDPVNYLLVSTLDVGT